MMKFTVLFMWHAFINIGSTRRYFIWRPTLIHSMGIRKVNGRKLSRNSSINDRIKLSNMKDFQEIAPV